MKPDKIFRRRFFLSVGIFLFIAAIGLTGLFVIRTNESVAYRLDNLISKIKYAIAPPEKVIFIPQDQLAAMVSATLKALTPPATSTPQPTTAITRTPEATSTPTIIPTSIPDRKLLKGFRHEFQQWNNCGPANLAMILSYWGWVGDQRNTASYLKPNPRDKNVMPYEMKAYIEENTELSVIIRYGGDVELLNTLVAAGFPVLVEKGFEGSTFEDWMGHYEVISGYDVEQKKVYAQDSYIGPNLPVTYAQLEPAWRAFNYVYLVIYPGDRASEVMRLLGPQADETTNLEYAAQIASVETVSLSGRDQFFAWYNRGTSLANLGDFTGAALAFDEAYKIYPSLEEGDRPWRMIWYQTGPYFAYYYTGRYYDVITLANSTLSAMSEPVLEESYVWRARARSALGDTTGAIEDLNLALQYHPEFPPALEELTRLTSQ
jgi:tetratricopeptide (TPR) repeat protein